MRAFYRNAQTKHIYTRNLVVSVRCVKVTVLCLFADYQCLEDTERENLVEMATDLTSLYLKNENSERDILKSRPFLICVIKYLFYRFSTTIYSSQAIAQPLYIVVNAFYEFSY